MIAQSELSKRFSQAGAFLGAKLKEARKAKKLTQKQLAKMAGINQATICHLEKNDYLNAGIFTWLALCQALGLKFSELLAEAERIYSPKQ